VWFTDEIGTLSLAKFPSRHDRRDVAAWEHLVTRMASDAGLDVPRTSLLDLGGEYRTFQAQRFDRNGDGRVGYLSAKSMTGRIDGESGASYLDLVDVIERHGAPSAISADLHQLFLRVVFIVLIGDRDDHLRNHGFLRRPERWRLAPAFDLTQSPEMSVHSLTFDGATGSPDLDVLRRSAGFYRISSAQAESIIDRMYPLVATWRDRARALHIPRAEMEAISPAFMVG